MILCEIAEYWNADIPVYLVSHIYAVFLFWAGTDFRELLADTCRKLSR